MPLPKIEQESQNSSSQPSDAIINSIKGTSSDNVQKKNNGSNTVQTLANNMSKGNVAEVSSNSSNSKILQSEFDQSQEQTSKEAESTRETIIQQSNQNETLIQEVQDSVKKSGNNVKNSTDENNNTIKNVAKKEEDRDIKNKKEEIIKNEQNQRKNNESVRKAESQRNIITEHLETIISLFKKNNNVKTGGGGASGGGFFGNFLSGLGSFTSGLISGGLAVLGKSMLRLVGRGISTVVRFGARLLTPLLIPVAKAAAIIGAGVAAGYGIVKLYDKIAGTNYADEGAKGMAGLLTEGTITPELTRIKEAEVEQAKNANKANERTKSTKKEMENSTSRIKETEKKYKEVPSDKLSSTGSFEDIEKRKEALQDANDILLQFKDFLVDNKQNTKTPAGLNSVSTGITQFVKDTYPVYETIMLRAGFDPQKDAPQGLENYASLYRQIQKSIKEGKAYTFKDVGGLEVKVVAPQVQKMIQVASTESEKNWSAMGLGGLEKIQGVDETDIKTKQSVSPKQSTTSTDKISARSQDREIYDSGSKSTQDSKVMVMVPPSSGGVSGSSGITSAPTPEGNTSRAAVDTIADPEIIAYAIGKQTQHATFPAIA